MQYISLFQSFGAAIVSTIAGFLWYSPILFGNKWQEEMGFTKDEQVNLRAKRENLAEQLSPYLAYLMSFAGDLLTAAVILALVSYSGLSNYTIVILCWLGFIMPVLFANTIYDGKSWILFLISSGYRLVALLLMATIFTIF